MPELMLPIDSPSLADAVITAVRTGVATSTLLPGETYSVYQVASLLGISRSPVREAITRMADAGLVEIIRNRGFRVVRPQTRDIHEIFDIRLALEPAAASRAAVGGTEQQHASIRAALESMCQAAERCEEPEFWSADRGLHHALMLAAGNARAAGLIEQLRETTALLGPPTTASGRTLTEIHAEHEPIVHAVLARDSAAAKSAMRRHLKETGRLLALRLRDGTAGLGPTAPVDTSSR